MSLKWDAGVSPLELPDFETQARKLRYQVLGDMCKRESAKFLLTAHHNDDQAETMLMRLASGATGLNLQGIKKHAAIPECWGRHGVHQSGRYEAAEERLMGRKQLRGEDLGKLERPITSRPLVEAGGVTVIRPLLEFEKAHLIETCEANNIGWEEDATNQESWRSPRNAVRSILTATVMPRALQKDSLLQVANDITTKNASINAHVYWSLSRCEVLKFDIRSGVLVVRIPERIISFDSRLHGDPGAFRQQVGARLLEYLICIVTPFETVRLQSLQNAVETIFGERRGSQSAVPQTGRTFTAGGALFQRTDLPVTNQEQTANPDLNPNHVWTLSRQPYQSDPDPISVSAALGLELHCSEASFSRFQLSDPGRNRAGNWTAWQLWDGRYWVRINNLTENTLVVRPLKRNDMQSIRSAISADAWKALSRSLGRAAAGKIRWTLPAIVEKHADVTISDKILVLPTLGKVGRLDISYENGSAKLEWEVRYKAVSLGRLKFDHNSPAKDLPLSDDIRHNSNFITSWED